MSNDTLAKRYATALFELSASSLAASEQAARALLAQTAEPAFANFLNNPTLSRNEQADVLASLIPAGIVRDLAVRVAKNRRLAVLPDILESFIAMSEAARGEVKVNVESANALKPTQAKALASGLGKALGKTVTLTTGVAPELLGGLRLKLGNTMVDYSAAKTLDRLAATLKSSPLGA